jgi:hypothetical protein
LKAKLLHSGNVIASNVEATYTTAYSQGWRSVEGSFGIRGAIHVEPGDTYQLLFEGGKLGDIQVVKTRLPSSGGIAETHGEFRLVGEWQIAAITHDADESAI